MNLSRDMALVIGLGVCAVLGIFTTYVSFYADAPKSSLCLGDQCDRTQRAAVEASFGNGLR